LYLGHPQNLKMELSFYKYQGTGNDFVLIDNRWNILTKNDTNLIKRLCDRKFGIGADGLLLLEKPDSEEVDFKMVYFNADGNLSSMCGNGGRCIVAFAHYLEIIGKETVFQAVDGLHKARISDHDIVSLEMQQVDRVQKQDDYVFLDTGSPHHVIFSDDVEVVDVKSQGGAIRHSAKYAPIGGTNVNFVEVMDTWAIKVRTFERGVEDETLSCGTGVTAAAIAGHTMKLLTAPEIEVQTPGGRLNVAFKADDKGYRDIWLSGPAKQVFHGTIRI